MANAAYRRVTVEAETVYPTDLFLRWITSRLHSGLPFRVRLAKLILPRKYGVVVEEGYEDLRV